MRKIKILKNIATNLFFTVTIGILGFVSNKYFADNMGMETLGLMRLFTQMVAYLNLADLGIGIASTYALYKPIAEKNHHQVSVILNTLDGFYKKIALIILILGGISCFFLENIVNTPMFGNKIYIFWSLYIINTALSYFFAKYSILFTANQEYSLVRKIQGSSRILINIAQLFVLVYLQSFLIFLILMALENLISGYFYINHYKKVYSVLPKVSEKDPSIFKDMKNLFWHEIASVIVLSTDYIVLSKFTTLSIVAKYSTYMILYQMIMTITGILTPALSPSIGNFIATNTKDKIYLQFKKINSLYMIIGTIFVGASYYLFAPFIKVWMGEEFLLSNLTLILLLTNLFIGITRSMIVVFKSNSGFYDDVYAPILESILNLGISIYLVQKIGLNGVIIGTIISNVAIVYLLQPMLVFIKCFDKKWYNYIFDLINYLIKVSLIFYSSHLFINLLKITTDINSWKEWILLALKIGPLYVVVTVIIFSFDKGFRNFSLEIFSKIKAIIKK